MKFYKTIILLIFCNHILHAQFELWGGVGVDAGVPISTSYENQKSVLRPNFCKLYNENIYLQARFFKRIGLEAYASQNTQLYRYSDIKFHGATGNKYEGIIKVKNNFTSLGLNLIYRQPLIGSYAGIYFSGGYRMNYTGTSNVVERQTFSLNSEEFEFASKSYGSGAALLFEGGCQIITDDERNMITIGLQYHAGLSKLYDGELTNRKDGIVQYTDRVSSALDYFGLTFKYHYRLFNYDKSDKIEDENQSEEDYKKHNEYVQPAYRKVELKDHILVKTKKIIIEIYEPYREDNDQVSISINGKWILQNYVVERKHYQIEVELYPGVNTLVFQAENLGDIPPNTATLFVIENGKKRKFDMMANLSTSQSIEIEYKP